MKKLVFLLFLSLSALCAMAQEDLEGTEKLDKLISNENISIALLELREQISELTTASNWDSLKYYPYYVGKINELNFNKQRGKEEVISFEQSFHSHTDNPAYLYKLHTGIASYYESISELAPATAHHQQSLEYAKEIEGNNSMQLAASHYNLSSSFQSEGKFDQMVYHSRLALKYYELADENEKGFEDLYFANLGMGVAMYFTAKIDSAAYYWERAEKEITKDSISPINMFYRPALLSNNLAAVYMMTGRTSKAITAMENAIAYNKEFIHSDAEDFKRNDARIAQYQYIENLAGIYLDLGDFEKNLRLLTFAHNQKKEVYEQDNPEIFKSYILLAGAAEKSLQLNKAESYINKALGLLESHPNRFFDWHSSAWHTKGNILHNQQKTAEATQCMEQAREFIQKASKGSYSNEDIEILRSMSDFFCATNQTDKALETAQSTYRYLTTNNPSVNILQGEQELELSNIYFARGDYTTAAEYADRSNETFDVLKSNASSELDSLKIEFHQAFPLFMKLKSSYGSRPRKDSVFLKQLLTALNKPLSILEKQKRFVRSYENVKILMDQFSEVFDFSKQINIDLYEQTGEIKYLLDALSQHENGVYNRIRSRLNIRDQLGKTATSHTLFHRERTLKQSLASSLESDDVGNFLKAQKEWDEFLDSLKTTEAKYYHMRYAFIEQNLESVQNNLPKNTTLIRYFFTGDRLHAVVIGRHTVNYFPLEFTSNQGFTDAIQPATFDIQQLKTPLHELYKQLWEPLQSTVKTERVIIIPDKELFNISFEMLTTVPVSSFNEFTEHSLLAKHSISYHFSSLLINTYNESSQDYEENYVAFAPGFTEEMKQSYQKKVTDPLQLDVNYFNLLPQPFIVELVEKYSSVFDGEPFINEAASKEAFIRSAANHKIIHIGTHAESNNLTPELSRLIFTKLAGTNSTLHDNHLYSYEIYDQDLSSELAILSACETGKPAYQPGEGMISLSHAFTYAGSKSILTSLWQVDEQSSATILDEFYQNLKKGNTKDRALRKAKLSYLKSSTGRLQAPQYWAGLIIIGDTGPVELNNTNSLNQILLICLAVILVAVIILFFKRKNRLKSGPH